MHPIQVIDTVLAGDAPFHPLHGRDFGFVASRQNWGEDRVHLHDEKPAVVLLPAGRTDVTAPDLFVVIAAGRCPFTTDGLLAVAYLADQLRVLVQLGGTYWQRTHPGWAADFKISVGVGQRHTVADAADAQAGDLIAALAGRLTSQAQICVLCAYVVRSGDTASDKRAGSWKIAQDGQPRPSRLGIAETNLWRRPAH